MLLTVARMPAGSIVWHRAQLRRERSAQDVCVCRKGRSKRNDDRRETTTDCHSFLTRKKPCVCLPASTGAVHSYVGVNTVRFGSCAWCHGWINHGGGPSGSVTAKISYPPLEGAHHPTKTCSVTCCPSMIPSKGVGCQDDCATKSIHRYRSLGGSYENPQIGCGSVV